MKARACPHGQHLKTCEARDEVLKRTVHRDHNYYRFIFETDAADDCIGRVDAPGVKCLDRAAAEGATANPDHLIDGWYLSEGVAEMRLRLPAGVQDKDVLCFTGYARSGCVIAAITAIASTGSAPSAASLAASPRLTSST